MDYRLEYAVIGVDTGGSGKKEFPATSDEEAAKMVPQLCEEIVLKGNARSTFWTHFSVVPTRLVRIVQREINMPVELRAEDRVTFVHSREKAHVGARAPEKDIVTRVPL